MKALRAASGVIALIALLVSVVALAVAVLALTDNDDASTGKENPAAYAIELVDDAVARLAEEGIESTLAYYNSEESADGPWYVFILEDRGGDLYTVAHASRPDLVGTTRERIDSSGYDYGEAFENVTEASGGRWVSYLFTHPETRSDAPKHTWVVRRGNLVFGAGWYEGI